MRKPLAGDFILVLSFFLVSWWLMTKSFGYDARVSQFRVARHEVGDFGLHISLIRSFAWGDNAPPESPFFPGKPLVYHYAVDWFAGQFVRWGVRIDYALNGISAVALTILLFGLYRLGGIFAIVLFLLPSNLSLIEILKNAPKDVSLFSYFWRFPDYIHKGPFDGSMITIYTTLSPFLNQRHLVAGMAIGITVIWLIVKWVGSKKQMPTIRWIAIGFVLGASTRIHLMVVLATGIVAAALLIGKRNKALLFFLGAAFLTAVPHLMQIMSVRSGASQLWNPGYLAPRPLSPVSWIYFWIANLGVLVVLIPLAFRHARSSGKRVLLGAGVLFLVANTMQASYRIEHNHSLVNYAVVLTLPFVARLLAAWWARHATKWRIAAVCALVLATASGAFNLMVVKNDYQMMVDDVPQNRFMLWVRTQTDSGSVFISTHALYDPVTIAGRKNYLGQEYYVTVMGYDYWRRRKQVDAWLNNFNQHIVAEMKKNRIDYIAIPKNRKDFPYAVIENSVSSLLSVAYEDESITVYEL